MGILKIMDAVEFMVNPEIFLSGGGGDKTDQPGVDAVVSEIIAAVREEGDAAVRRYALRFEKETPEKFELPPEAAREAWENLKAVDPALASSLSFAADNIRRFAELQKEQFVSFEAEILPGLFTGQRVIPIDRAAVYVPGGRFPLISSALMGLIPAAAAGVREKILVSPPAAGGLPDRRILAAAHLAGADRFFALGGAQAIAALALGTESVPRVDLIAGPGNRYVAAAKRLLFGEVGIDFIAGPTDVLVIVDGSSPNTADFVAADMIAQAEHDPDACARALVPGVELAEQITAALERRLVALSDSATARASLDSNGLVVVYQHKEEAVRIANIIAPEHLELQTENTEWWIPRLNNFGSLFIGHLSAEALGDYSAGINHTLPTSASARFTGGLSVRNFLKTVTTLRCVPGDGFENSRNAAEVLAKAEGLEGHALSAALRGR